MQILRKPLKEIYGEIRNNVKNALKSAEELAEVKRVVYGERVRIGTLQTPAIWIVPEPYTPEPVGGHTTEHNIRYNLVALVKENDPEQALEKAEDIALAIYDVILADRTLGGLVFDVVPSNISPAYEMGNSTQVCWSAVTFDFRVKRKE